MSVLVTGARGFVGAHLVDALRARGHEVEAVASRGAGPRRDGVRWHVADLLEPGAAERLAAAAGAEHLIHLAWLARPALYTSPDNVRWAEATLALVRAFAGQGGRRVVLGGSCAEYAWSGAGPCVESATPTEPATLYGASKLACGRLALAAAQALGLSVASARIFFLFGPGEHPDRLVPAVARAVLAGEPAETTAGTQVRDYLDVRDAADALAVILAAGIEGAVNVGSGVPVAVGELAERVAQAAGRPELLRRGARPTPAGEAQAVYADVRRLREEAGWAPRIALEDGVADAVAYWRERS